MEVKAMIEAKAMAYVNMYGVLGTLENLCQLDSAAQSILSRLKKPVSPEVAVGTPQTLTPIDTAATRPTTSGLLTFYALGVHGSGPSRDPSPSRLSRRTWPPKCKGRGVQEQSNPKRSPSFLGAPGAGGRGLPVPTCSAPADPRPPPNPRCTGRRDS